MPKPYQQRKKNQYGTPSSNGRRSAGTTILKKKAIGKIKKMLNAKKLQIKGVGKYGSRIRGRGAYSISEVAEKIATPFVDDTKSKGIVNRIARYAGKTVGGYVGLGDEIGNAASYLSRAFGFGDYTIKKNSFQDYGNIAQFANHGTITFSHREYICDINSSTGFQNQSFIINPGNSTLFPWLSTIAKNFEQYEFLGLIFEFKSTSATAVGSVNTGLGTVIMSTDYDVLDQPYADKRAMEVAEFSTSAAPFNSQVHPIECDPKQNVMRQLFIQPGNLASSYPDDPRFSALGNFQIATSGMQAISTIGELWVSYHVKLLKPQLEYAESLSTTTIHSDIFLSPAATTCTISQSLSTNPGAIKVDLLTGPPRLRYTCVTVAGIGQYAASQALISDTATTDPTYVALDSGNYVTGTASLLSQCMSTSGSHNGRSQANLHYAATKGGATFGVNNNPVSDFTLFKFASVGDTITISLVWQLAATTYMDAFLIPYNNHWVLPTYQRPKLEIDDLRNQLALLQTQQQSIQKNFVELKDEIKEELQDNEYEVTVGSDDVARLIDKLASVNLIKNTASEIDECLKATVDMLGKNLTLSDRIRLEHYYTNLKKYHL